jgi:hypothetical protein
VTLSANLGTFIEPISVSATQPISKNKTINRVNQADR